MKKRKLNNKKMIWFILLFIVLLFVVLYYTQSYPGEKKFGVSFSHKYAQQLGLDDKEVYTAILDDLHVTDLKLSTYFDDIAKAENLRDFTLLDWQISEATKRNVDVVLAIGMRTPRWPECHTPEWFDQKSKEEQDKALLSYIFSIVNRYRNNETVVAWQVENEPQLSIFGECPPFDRDLFMREIALVRELDDRPILTTASGEFGNWNEVAQYVDIIGTSMYRIVYSEKLGYINYDLFFPPAYYELKRRLTDKQVWITEFQAEPWAPIPVEQLTIEEEEKSMSHEHFQYLFKFLSRTNFDKVYMWGPEWWYFKRVQGDSFYWDYAAQEIPYKF